eukprot:TRINITY_DN25534_c0_g1_i1.p1 TRINITY_DN25534_c0_g1~~TRINITY_DN25534_c0_g1_i1.p1  ORF type:complete len:350 (+),score=41.84 TRINITY_DN25534_c0_g1_i1:92-1141(+)
MEVDDILLGREAEVIWEMAETWNQLSSLSYSRRFLKTCFDSASVPPISIHDYVDRLWKYMGCSVHCFGFSVAYIQRILDNHPDVTVGVLNVHTLILSSVVVAAKFHDDSFRCNAYYARVGGVTPNALFSLESNFLELLDWRAGVTSEEFESCCKLLFSHDRIERLRSRHQDPLSASRTTWSGADQAIPAEVLSDCEGDKHVPSSVRQSEALTWADSNGQDLSQGPSLRSGAAGGVGGEHGEGCDDVLGCSDLARSPSSQSTTASAVVSEAWEDSSKSSCSDRSTCSTLPAQKSDESLNSAAEAALDSPSNNVERHTGSAVLLWARWQVAALMETLDSHLSPCFQLRFSA